MGPNPSYQTCEILDRPQFIKSCRDEMIFSSDQTFNILTNNYPQKTLAKNNLLVRFCLDVIEKMLEFDQMVAGTAKFTYKQLAP